MAKRTKRTVEYVTTSMPWEPGGTRDAKGDWINTDIPAPLVPNSEDWEMVGSAATPAADGQPGRLFWFWRIERPS